MKWLRYLLDQPGRYKHERKVLAMVEQFGLHITNVDFVHDDMSCGFSYTAGLPQSVGQPNLIVFALPLELRANMLLETFEQCRGGLVLADFGEVHGLTGGPRCILRDVLPGNFAFNWFNSAMMYEDYRTGKPIESAIQLVWPSAATGLFPWEDRSADVVGATQTPLYEKVVAI